MSKRSYFAADVPVITAVTTPVAPNVPRGVEMVEDSKHIDDGPAINHVVPSTASTSSTEDTASQKEIAKQLTGLLSDKGIPQRLFAEKVLNRSQGSFSTYLSKAPAEIPKTHSRAIWVKLKEFLESQEQQQELMGDKEKSKLFIIIIVIL